MIVGGPARMRFRRYPPVQPKITDRPACNLRVDGGPDGGRAGGQGGAAVGQGVRGPVHRDRLGGRRVDRLVGLRRVGKVDPVEPSDAQRRAVVHDLGEEARRDLGGLAVRPDRRGQEHVGARPRERDVGQPSLLVHAVVAAGPEERRA